MSELNELVSHLRSCRKTDAAVVVDGNADELVSALIEQGWTYGGVEFIAGKRVRYLTPPDRVVPA